MAKYYMMALVDKKDGMVETHEAQTCGIDLEVGTCFESLKSQCRREQEYLEQNCPEAALDYEMRVIELGRQHAHVIPKEATKVWVTIDV